MIDEEPLEPLLRDALRDASPRAEADYDALAARILRVRVHGARVRRWSDAVIPFAIAAGLAALAFTWSSRGSEGVMVANTAGVDRDSAIVAATLSGSSDPLIDRVSRPADDASLIDALTH